MENNGLIGHIVTPDRLRQLLDKEQELETIKRTGKVGAQVDVEKDLNEVPAVKAQLEKAISETFPVYTFKEKEYALMANSKIKVEGVLAKLIAHPVYGAAFKAVFPSKEEFDKLGDKWLNVVIYKCLYPNPEGEIWTRIQEEFESKFVAKP